MMIYLPTHNYINMGIATYSEQKEFRRLKGKTQQKTKISFKNKELSSKSGVDSTKNVSNKNFISLFTSTLPHNALSPIAFSTLKKSLMVPGVGHSFVAESKRLKKSSYMPSYATPTLSSASRVFNTESSTMRSDSFINKKKHQLIKVQKLQDASKIYEEIYTFGLSKEWSHKMENSSVGAASMKTAFDETSDKGKEFSKKLPQFLSIFNLNGAEKTQKVYNSGADKPIKDISEGKENQGGNTIPTILSDDDDDKENEKYQRSSANKKIRNHKPPLCDIPINVSDYLTKEEILSARFTFRLPQQLQTTPALSVTSNLKSAYKSEIEELLDVSGRFIQELEVETCTNNITITRGTDDLLHYADHLKRVQKMLSYDCGLIEEIYNRCEQLQFENKALNTKLNRITELIDEPMLSSLERSVISPCF